MKSTHVHIRPFNEADRDKLKEIYLLGRIQVFHWVDSNLLALNDFDAHTKDEDIWVAECDDEIAGFIAVWSPDAFIHHLYVDAAHKGKGIGKALLDLAAQTYPLPLSLKCLVKNEAALQFYRALGWQIVEEGRDTLGDYFLMKSI